MPRVRLDMGPTGTNRVSLDGQHLVRYWRAELGCSEDEWKKDIAVQTWKTAGIAQRKFRYLKQATVFAMISLVPWTWLLIVSTWTR